MIIHLLYRYKWPHYYLNSTTLIFILLYIIINHGSCYSQNQTIPRTTSSPNIPTNRTGVQFLKPLLNTCSTNLDCNNGTCSDGKCYCTPGFTGHRCIHDIDECRLEREPCFNNGICVDSVNNFTCNCLPGFEGWRCEESIDMCVNSPCQNNATCINHRTDFSCQCLPGFEGKLCSINTDDCLKKPCKNNATCIDGIDDYVCLCGDTGFSGKNCDIDFDDCSSKPCGPFTKECIDKIKDFECICHDGFTGKKCDIDIDECASNPCENNGECIQKSTNISSVNPSLFVNYSLFSGFKCNCPPEFEGDRCEDKKKCFTKPIEELCGSSQAECVNVNSSYECLISATFDGSMDKRANYKVNGDFKFRKAFIRFKSLSGGTLMSFEATDGQMKDLIINTSGIYLNGSLIENDTGNNLETKDYLDGSERTLQFALNSELGIKSIFLAYSPTVTHLPFRGCLQEVRLDNQLVPMIEQPYGNNHSFEIKDWNFDLGVCQSCFKSDCQNNGRCDDSVDRINPCTCPEAFTGPFCASDVNECAGAFNPCLHGGLCENYHGGYNCICRDGYKGERCAEISDYCKAKQPCNTGSCKSVNNLYQCECPSSHIGKRCEKKRDCINECHDRHAQCINNVTCACLPGLKSERIMCEYISSCRQVEGELCMNGGKCRDLESGGYSCACPDTHHGSICQFIVEKPQIDILKVITVACIGLILATCATISFVIFKSVRKARATQGTYSPSMQEKFGNSASDILQPPLEERLI